VIDTSASVAILFGEPEAATFAEILEQDLVRLISAASVRPSRRARARPSALPGPVYECRSHPSTWPAARHALAFGKYRQAAALSFGGCVS